jgi:predicted nuclease of predicted toxin-antitoxin system
MAWARSNGFIVFTHDLDFGTILASTNAEAPSVFQVRTQDISPQHIGSFVLSALEQFEERLKQGALVSLDKHRAKARILPLSMQE